MAGFLGEALRSKKEENGFLSYLLTGLIFYDTVDLLDNPVFKRRLFKNFSF
jgi:hypothetical protein